LSQRIEELNAKDWDELMQNFDPYSTCNDCNYLTLTVQYGLAIYKLFDYLTSWISGLVDGIGLEIWDIIKSVLSSALHPVETIRGIYEAIKIISSQPEIMIQAMMESVYKDQLDAFTSTNKNYRAYYYSRAIARFGVLVFTTGAPIAGVIKGIVKLGKSIKDKVLLLPKSTIQDTRVYRVLHNTTVTLKNTNITATLVLIGEKLYIKIGQILTQLKTLTTEQFNSFVSGMRDGVGKTKLVEWWRKAQIQKMIMNQDLRGYTINGKVKIPEGWIVTDAKTNGKIYTNPNSHENIRLMEEGVTVGNLNFQKPYYRYNHKDNLYYDKDMKITTSLADSHIVISSITK